MGLWQNIRVHYLTFQAVRLGQWLRKRYVDDLGFFPRQYEEQSFSLRTTTIQRTSQTLHGVLSGLYPDLKVLGNRFSSPCCECCVCPSK